MISYETEVWRAVAAAVRGNKIITPRNDIINSNDCCIFGAHPLSKSPYPYWDVVARFLGLSTDRVYEIMDAFDGRYVAVYVGDSPAVAALKEAREIDFELLSNPL